MTTKNTKRQPTQEPIQKKMPEKQKSEFSKVSPSDQDSKRVAWTIAIIAGASVIALSLYLGYNGAKKVVPSEAQKQETPQKDVNKQFPNLEVIPNVDKASIVAGSILGYYTIPVVPANIQVKTVDIADSIRGLEPAMARQVLKKLGVKYVAFTINGLAQMKDYPIWAFQNRAVKYFNMVVREEVHRTDGQVWVVRVIYEVI